VPTARDAFPHSDAAAQQSLAIPIFPELTQSQLEEVVSAVGDALS
jgi:dTDP-4-amino-4,6-dideoxygalactose transaminase